MIEELIKNYTWPSTDAVTFGNGKMIVLDVCFGRNDYLIKQKLETTLKSFLEANPDDLTAFDIFDSVVHKQYKIHVGSGSYEGEGILYVTDEENGKLNWFAFFENSDSFNQVEVNEEGIINAFTENGVLWQFHIDNPLQIELLRQANAKNPH